MKPAPTSAPLLRSVPDGEKRWRLLRGTFIGFAIGCLLNVFLFASTSAPEYLQMRRDAPRLAQFERDCAHPVQGNSAFFAHAKVGQDVCKVYPGVVRITHSNPYHDGAYWRYRLDIGNQTLGYESKHEASGNPEAVGYATDNMNWNNDIPVPVDALFWHGVLMSISSRKYGYEKRIQTVSNPSTAGHSFDLNMLVVTLGWGVTALGLMGALIGFMVAQNKIDTQEKGLSAKDRATKTLQEAPLPSDATLLAATARKAVWSMQGYFLILQTMTVWLGAVTYSQALHPPHFAVPTPPAPPNWTLVGGAVALGVGVLGFAVKCAVDTIHVKPPFRSLHWSRLGANNVITLAHLSWAPLLYASTATHNVAFFAADIAALWAVVQLVVVPRYRQFWRAAQQAATTINSPLQPG